MSHPSEQVSASNETASPNAASRAQALYQSLFELMPGSVVLLNDQACVLDANPSFCRQIGYTREELLGKHVSTFSKDPPETIQSNLERLLAGEILEHNVANLHKDGSLRHYELREKAITLPDGTRGVLALSSDITRRVKAEEEKLELQRQFLHAEKLKSLGFMAGGIAHDFNNLLAVIIGNIELSLMEANDRPHLQSPLREAMTAANRAAHLTRQMLTYSGRGRFTVADVDLNNLVNDMRGLLDQTVSRKASLQFQLEKVLPQIVGDKAQLQQVLLNLVTNASESLGDEPGLVTVTTAERVCDAAFLSANRTGTALKPGHYVMLEVSDTGSGMELSVLEKLFDPFFSTKFTGRGLGMSVVLGAVRGHDGGILVNSRVGQGTIVKILLPAGMTQRVAGVSIPGATKYATTSLPVLKGTVLVVDDEAIMRSMVERLLKRVGLRVLQACDAEEAVSIFKEHSAEITFVLLDLTMPGRDGVKTLAELREHQPSVKAVLTSGYSKENVSQYYIENGFVAFIAKPYEAGNLLEVARKICVGEL